MNKAAATAPPATRPSARHKEEVREGNAEGWSLPACANRAWMFFHTRARGAIGATDAAIGASRDCQSPTERDRAASSPIHRSKRLRAPPRSVPSAYSAASRSCSAGLFLNFKAVLEPQKAAAHPRLHRAERLAQMARQL